MIKVEEHREWMAVRSIITVSEYLLYIDFKTRKCIVMYIGSFKSTIV